MNKTLKAAFLATTGLSLFGYASAVAAPLFETTDFSNTLGGANVVTQLSPDFVQGGIDFPGDADFIKWAGLAPGSSYNFTFLLDFAVDAAALDSSGAVISSSGLVPADGMLLARLTDDGAEDFEFYRVTLEATLASAVPEPATLALFGIGAAGALGLRRRRPRP